MWLTLFSLLSHQSLFFCIRLVSCIVLSCDLLFFKKPFCLLFNQFSPIGTCSPLSHGLRNKTRLLRSLPEQFYSDLSALQSFSIRVAFSVSSYYVCSQITSCPPNNLAHILMCKWPPPFDSGLVNRNQELTFFVPSAKDSSNILDHPHYTRMLVLISLNIFLP